MEVHHTVFHSSLLTPLFKICALASVLVLAMQPSGSYAEKRLQLSFPVAETGFDPAKVHDAYSGAIVEALFERLVSYDYYARPLKLVAGTAQQFSSSPDARTYTFVLKKGIFFSPD